MTGLKKKVCCVVALFAMLGLLFASRPLMAQGSVAAESVPSNSTPGAGAQIMVNINIDASKTSPAELLGSFTGTLKWNSSVLSFVSQSNLKAGFTGVVNTADVSSGQLAFNGANPSGLKEKSNVLTVTFNVTGANGTRTTLDLEFSAMAAALTFTNLLPILTVTDGAVTVTPVIVGRVTARAVCPTFEPAQNSSITIPIFVNMTAAPAPDDKLGSFTGSLKWDPAVLQLSSHSGLKSGFTGVVVTSGTNSGQISFNGSNSNGAAGDVNILEVTFTVMGPGGSTTAVDLGFSAMTAAVTLKDLIPILTVNDCKVTIGPPSFQCNPNNCSGPALFPTPRGGALGQRLAARDKDTLYVDLRMKENAQPVDAFGFVINVNPNQLSFFRASRGNLTASFNAVNANETPVRSGRVICGGFGTAPIPANSNGVLLTLAFVVKCQASDSSLITISNLADDVAGFNACCNVFRCASCIENGDVNGDGRLTPGDALCAFQIFLDGGTLPASCNTPGFTCELDAADVTCDGIVTPGDALAIFNRFIAGLPPTQCFAKSALARTVTAVEPYQLELKQQTLPPAPGNNAKLKITLAVDNPAGLNAFGLQLTYPNHKLDFLGVERTALTAGWVQLRGQANQPGVLTIGGYNQTALTANAPGELFQLVFAGKGRPTAPDEIKLWHLTDDFKHAVVKTGGLVSTPAVSAPEVFMLHQNYPNPLHTGFAPNETLIRFDLPGQEAMSVELAIYNLHGQMVRRLVSGKRSPGANEVTWDGKDETGRVVASGMYLYRLKTAAFFETKRLTVVR